MTSTTRRRLSAVLAALLLSACAGSSPGSPSSPTAADPAPLSYRGATINALDGAPLGRIVVQVGSQSAMSDDSGAFEVQDLAQGAQPLVISGGGIVERRRTITLPAGDARETLIPSSFDLAAFDEMFRGTGQLQRWTSAPALVVLATVMQYETFGSEDEFHATSEELSDGDVTLLVEHLTEGLVLLTGGAFQSFSSVEIERPAKGEKASTLRAGKIVVGRYKGLQSLSNTIGFGRWATAGSAEVVGGSIYLDRSFDASHGARRLLRIHELGHALGYMHVTTRPSIMNPSIGPEPTDFDRQAATIGFQRQPGNQSPDRDSEGEKGVRPLQAAAPVICGHGGGPASSP